MLVVAIHSAPPPTTQPVLVVLNDVLLCQLCKMRLGGVLNDAVCAEYSMFAHAAIATRLGGDQTTNRAMIVNMQRIVSTNASKPRPGTLILRLGLSGASA
jgi:hypothetical protein